MRVLIDADMIAHEVGHLRKKVGTDEDGEDIMELCDLEEVKPLAKGRLLSIAINSQAGGWKSYLTRGKNFRHRIATLLPYKGHREDNPRNNVDAVKQFLHEELEAEWCDHWEADDAISQEQWADLLDVGSKHGWSDDALRSFAGTVIASRDKDLDTVPGWHYKWWLKSTKKDRDGNEITEEQRQVQKGEPYWVSVREAFRNFYKQLLMGDSSDNIKGLYGVGPKSAWVTQLDEMDDEYDMYDHVEDKYRKHYGNYSDKFLKETANLLHMHRRKDDKWEPPHERDKHYWYL
jgi:hypothetical protein